MLPQDSWRRLTVERISFYVLVLIISLVVAITVARVVANVSYTARGEDRSAGVKIRKERKR
jgi:intracellular septation protein A